MKRNRFTLLDETVTGVTGTATVTVGVTDARMTDTEVQRRKTGMREETEMNLQQLKGKHLF